MEPAPPTPRPVAQLAGAHLPADHGLAGLGLLMQLAGSLFFALMAYFAVLPVFMHGAPEAWTLFVIGATGAIRSACHRAAGTALVYGSPSGPFRMVRIYVGVAVAATVIWLYMMHRQHLPGAALLSVGAMLLAWPLTLIAVMAWPKLRRFGNESLPAGEDLGFEGAAVLMTILGVIGVLFAGLMLAGLLQMPSDLTTSPHGLLAIGVFLMLGARSVLHTIAGVRGTSGASADGATAAASRYFSFGVVSSVIAGGALMIELMMSALHPEGLLAIGMVVYLLLVWPLALRRFFSERNFTTLLAGDEAPVHRRAPDAGLTSLGWLLLGSGVFALATALPGALLGHGSDLSPAAMFGLLGDRELEHVANAARSPWWNVALGLVQLWAAIELVTMSSRHRLAGTIFGAVSAATTLYLYWPALKNLKSTSALLLAGGPSGPMQFFSVALSLVLPVATLFLVNRKLMPEATARVRADR